MISIYLAAFWISLGMSIECVFNKRLKYPNNVDQLGWSKIRVSLNSVYRTQSLEIYGGARQSCQSEHNWAQVKWRGVGPSIDRIVASWPKDIANWPNLPLRSLLLLLFWWFFLLLHLSFHHVHSLGFTFALTYFIYLHEHIYINRSRLAWEIILQSNSTDLLLCFAKWLNIYYKVK